MMFQTGDSRCTRLRTIHSNPLSNGFRTCNCDFPTNDGNILNQICSLFRFFLCSYAVSCSCAQVQFKCACVNHLAWSGENRCHGIQLLQRRNFCDEASKVIFPWFFLSSIWNSARSTSIHQNSFQQAILTAFLRKHTKVAVFTDIGCIFIHQMKSFRSNLTDNKKNQQKLERFFRFTCTKLKRHYIARFSFRQRVPTGQHARTDGYCATMRVKQAAVCWARWITNQTVQALPVAVISSAYIPINANK